MTADTVVVSFSPSGRSGPVDERDAIRSHQSHGVYETLERARGCVSFDRLRAYSIWSGFMDRNDENTDLEFVCQHRVEHCEPYDGDDDRVRESLGIYPHDDTPSLPIVTER